MKRRLTAIYLLFIILLLTLGARLALIQIIDSEKYAFANTKQQRIILNGEDTRGTIYDRNGNRLTGTDHSYIYILKKEALDETAERIFQMIGARKIKNENNRYEVYRSSIFSKEAAYILKRDYGAFVIKGSARYVTNQPAVHFIGYINEIDGTGISGIEKSFNDILSKKQKVVYASVDGKRMIIPGLGISSTVTNPDCGVYTTLDIKIQKKAEEILENSGKNGSIVVLDAENGELLAGASTPFFDPEKIEDYLDSDNEEFLNKVTQSVYPPGSIFKIVVAAAALEKGVVNADTKFLCKGSEDINGTIIKCSKEEGHGEINFRDAFAESCNSAFIQLGAMTGGEDILKMAEDFGLGENAFQSEIEEKPGLLPDRDDIQGAGIGNLSIGQGKLLITPAQATRVTSIIASGGIDYGLTLIRGITEGGEIEPLGKKPNRRVITKETADLISNLMVDTVNHGTADNLTGSGVSIAGKTGSAEAYYHGEMVVHGWFTGFFPADKPAYVITVFVESGGSGRASAVPLFQQMAEYLNLAKL
ncbi:MAG: penicillin-binding protein 2 [Eubacteriales bacterium]|nr:penicillin-binding protein 2 [Eubacteriales bacterium]MDD3199480.1 penicillin-binding protein 2 [Eubacteriales bacterium]MDD4121522.1 penicillin-binding protein 2 [Eubacteriales bacterium]MDD4629727.1 penicillin-binding protein 2 [Eubacteriales bacterium]